MENRNLLLVDDEENILKSLKRKSSLKGTQFIAVSLAKRASKY